jgi:hypothetical protein
MFGDNSFCTPEEKKYNKKKDTTKNGIAYLSLDDWSMGVRGKWWSTALVCLSALSLTALDTGRPEDPEAQRPGGPKDRRPR